MRFALIHRRTLVDEQLKAAAASAMVISGCSDAMRHTVTPATVDVKRHSRLVKQSSVPSGIKRAKWLSC